MRKKYFRNFDRIVLEVKLDDVMEYVNCKISGAPTPAITFTPEEEFRMHCSNMQAWVEHDYDTRLLQIGIAFGVLKRLFDAGDPLAKKTFNKEIMSRIKSGDVAAKNYLIRFRYFDDLTEKDRDLLINGGFISWQEVQDVKHPRYTPKRYVGGGLKIPRLAGGCGTHRIPRINYIVRLLVFNDLILNSPFIARYYKICKSILKAGKDGEDFEGGKERYIEVQRELARMVSEELKTITKDYRMHGEEVSGYTFCTLAALNIEKYPPLPRKLTEDNIKRYFSYFIKKKGNGEKIPEDVIGEYKELIAHVRAEYEKNKDTPLDTEGIRNLFVRKVQRELPSLIIHDFLFNSPNLANYYKIAKFFVETRFNKDPSREMSEKERDEDNTSRKYYREFIRIVDDEFKSYRNKYELLYEMEFGRTFLTYVSNVLARKELIKTDKLSRHNFEQYFTEIVSKKAVGKELPPKEMNQYQSLIGRVRKDYEEFLEKLVKGEYNF